MNVTLLGNKIFTDVIKVRWSYWIQVDSKSNDPCPYKDSDFEIQRHTRRRALKTEAEIGVRQVSATEL